MIKDIETCVIRYWSTLMGMQNEYDYDDLLVKSVLVPRPKVPRPKCSCECKCSSIKNTIIKRSCFAVEEAIKWTFLEIDPIEGPMQKEDIESVTGHVLLKSIYTKNSTRMVLLNQNNKDMRFCLKIQNSETKRLCLVEPPETHKYVDKAYWQTHWHKRENEFGENTICLSPERYAKEKTNLEVMGFYKVSKWEVYNHKILRFKKGSKVKVVFIPKADGMWICVFHNKSDEDDDDTDSDRDVCVCVRVDRGIIETGVRLNGEELSASEYEGP